MPVKATKPRLQAVEGSKSHSTVSLPESLVDESDGAFRQFIDDALAFSACLQDVRNRLGAFVGLPGTQYTLLVSLAQLRSDGDVGVNQLARHLHLSGAFVTIEVGKLVAAGLVRKQTHPEDRRRVQLNLTPAGREMLGKLAPIQKLVNDALFESVTAEDFQVLRDVFARLAASGDRSVHLLEYVTQPGQEGHAAAR